jgi:hypothetical protein
MKLAKPVQGRRNQTLRLDRAAAAQLYDRHLLLVWPELPAAYHRPGIAPQNGVLGSSQVVFAKTANVLEQA